MLPAHDTALYDAAGSGNADGVAQVIAALANLTPPTRWCVITEEERGPPDRLCGRVPRAPVIRWSLARRRVCVRTRRDSALQRGGGVVIDQGAAPDECDRTP